MHTSSYTPTQYEVESWIFPHPGVRRLQDASNSGPQRHSVHSVAPLMKGIREREERKRLKKGHRRWHSNEHQIVHGGLRMSKEDKIKGGSLRKGSLKSTLEMSGPLGHHSGLFTQDDKEEVFRRHFRSVEHGLVVCDGNLHGDGVMNGKGRTKRNGRQGISESRDHTPALRLPSEGENWSGEDGKVRQNRRCHSHGQLDSMLAAEARVGEEVKGLSSGSGSVKSRRGRIQSQLCDSSSGVSLHMVGKRWGRSRDIGVRPSELLGAWISPSHQPHKRPWVSKPSAPLPWIGHTSHATKTQQQQHSPSYSCRQPATVLKHQSADFKALLRSLSCKAWTVGIATGPSVGVGESETMGVATGPSAGVGPSAVSQSVSGGHQDSQGKDVTESDGEEEFSLDYHNFIRGSSKAEVASSQNTSPVPGTAVTPSRNKFSKTGVALGDVQAPSIVLNNESAHESPVSRFAHKVTQSLSHNPFPETLKPTATLRERRGRALAEKSDSPEAVRKLPQLGLSVLTNIPVSLSSSSISPPPSLTTAPLLREGTLQCIPLSTISSKEIDPEKLQPFIGPLLPQQPPPNRPLPHIPFPSPVKPREATKKSSASMARQVDGSEQGIMKGDMKRSMEATTEQHVAPRKGKGLRKKISSFFLSDQPARSADAAAATTYQPLSLTTSQDTERLSLSDIFDDVYNAARGSLKPSRGSHKSGRSSLQKSGRIPISAQSGNSLPPMQPEHPGTHDAKGAIAPTPTTSYTIEPPPLIDHPVVQGDSEIQDRLGLQRNTNSAAIPCPSTPNHALSVPGLPVRRQRPAESDTNASFSLPKPALYVTGHASQARLVKEQSQSTIIPDTHKNIDPSPAFDRTVDLTWYRTAREERGTIICSLPRPSGRYESVLNQFVAQYSKGRPFKKYDGKKRFPYFDLPTNIRFEVVRHLVTDTDTGTGRPILLNSKRQAFPAWPADAFVSLGSVLKPLQAAMWACPRLRAEVMVVLLLTRKFHVIFSPCVKERTQPLPTTWLFRYLHLMQDVSLEIDMTKLGFGHGWEATAMKTSMENVNGLIRRFMAEMLTRNSANSMGCLTIHCRRYFGYRQGPNTVQGHQSAYKYPLIAEGENELRSIVSGQDSSASRDGQPRNYNRRSPSLPPSAAKQYSGHLRHHADLPRRVPYVTEDQLSVASPLRALTGRVDSVRMVGFSEQWTYATHLAMWPEAERNAVSDAVKHYHIDRQTPSRHSYAAPGHAIFLDYGVDHGVHRYPPLPDSEPMVCVDYDRNNGLFVELGSGNVVSVTENGAYFHYRSLDPPTLSHTSAHTPGNLTSPHHPESLTFVPRPSRIPTPRSRGRISPMMQAMRNGTPVKAAAVLGLPGTMITSGQGEPLVTPTKPRTIRKTLAKTSDDTVHDPAQNTLLGTLASRHGLSSSTTDAMKPC